MSIYRTKNKRKKDNKAQYRVDVEITTSDGKRKRKTKCVYGHEEAKELERQLLIELKGSGSPNKMTVRQLYDEYIETKKHNVRQSSLQKTKSILKNHVLNTAIANKRITKLSKKDLNEWKNEISSKPIMVTTKNNAYREFNTLLNYAVRDMEYIPRNLLKELGRFKDPELTAATKAIRYYTPEQFKVYIAAAESCRKTMIDHGCCVFFYIAFYTGMRKGEIHALKWSDIEGNTIHITRSLSQKVKNPDGSYKEGAPKNKSSIRDIQIPKKLSDILADHRKLMERSHDDVEGFRVTGGLKPISDTTLANRNEKYADLAKLPHRTIHEFRHSHASVLCNNNINIMEVARRLGHKDPEMTWKVYAHLYPQAEEIAVSVLNSI